ncbi:hypothetical protein A3L12_06685 [Thermococcus sp. P6]|uniref:DUF835 domain-containing protein n=1 Tax=Thermococcus sp. P6 TaxID=122420 RepID=UPI000B5FC846|nr:DUF835 domain-containing protein [Thermococcus sp. P6]ASJ11009.1 hypothetical protein A3L12_06685 [Thermococcus sp. P6]
MVLGMSSRRENPRIVDYHQLDGLVKRNPHREKILVTRRHPSKFNRDNVRVVWVTRVSHPDAVPPGKLHVVEQIIWDRLNEGPADVILDALEYLILENGLESTLRFVAKLRDMALLKGSNFFVTVSDGIDDRTLNLLRRII